MWILELIIGFWLSFSNNSLCADIVFFFFPKIDEPFSYACSTFSKEKIEGH